MNLDLMTYVALGSIISIVFAYIMFNRVKSQPMGTDKMKKLSDIYTFIAYNHNTEPRIIGWSINNAINKVT